MFLCEPQHINPSWCGRVGDVTDSGGVSFLVFVNDNISRFRNATPPLFGLSSPHTCPHRTELRPLNMDITGHFESASCVIEVDRSATLAQVKGKLVAELGVPRARHGGMRMRGGCDIGDDELRICDTEIDEGCAVELYCTRGSICPGVIPHAESPYRLTVSPCDRYLAVVWDAGVSVFDTETHETWFTFRAEGIWATAFSPCSGWLSCSNEVAECIEVRRVRTGALAHSFPGGRAATWSPCGTMLLSGPQVWDIATGCVVHEWRNIGDNFEECYGAFGAAGNKMVTYGGTRVTIWDYTTGTEVRALVCRSCPNNVASSPNQPFVAACYHDSVRVWDIETGERVFEQASGTLAPWENVAVANDVVAACTLKHVTTWSISTGKQLCSITLQSGGECGLALSSCGGVLMYADEGGVKIVDVSHLT